MCAYSRELNRIQEEYNCRKKEISKDYYSLSKPENLFNYNQRVREVLLVLNREALTPLAEKSVLEIGCGTGQWLVDFESWGAEQYNLFGMDLDDKRAQIFKNQIPNAAIKIGDASKLPWNHEQFDFVLQSTVFTLVLDAQLKASVAKVMMRVLKPNSIILWYDFVKKFKH